METAKHVTDLGEAAVFWPKPALPPHLIVHTFVEDRLKTDANHERLFPHDREKRARFKDLECEGAALFK